MPKIIDISVTLEPGTTIWPGSPAFKRDQVRTLERDDVNVSNIAMDVHTGTHVDAPLHHLAGGASSADLALEAMVGPVQVVDLTGVDEVDRAALEETVDPATTRLLFKTGNSSAWPGTGPFTEDYVALNVEAAAWIADKDIRLVGNDYLSIQRPAADIEIHRILLRSGVVILEGINLAHVPAGHYTLMCLPLKIADSEGAPARAVLLEGSVDELG